MSRIWIVLLVVASCSRSEPRTYNDHLELLVDDACDCDDRQCAYEANVRMRELSRLDRTQPNSFEEWRETGNTIRFGRCMEGLLPVLW